jgi:uncharacterized protein YjiS (DUF1127 family)
MPPSAPGSRKASWARRLPSLGGRRWLAFLARPPRPLHGLSDHLLHDIGLSRADAGAEVRRLGWPR